MLLRYWVLIVVLAIGWGSSFFFNEILLREIGPMMTSIGRVGLGALGCWVWILVRRERVRVTRAQVVALTIFGMFQYAIPLTVYPITQQFITSSMAGIINAMTPIMVVIVSHFWAGSEKATWNKSIGVLLGFAGIIIVVSPSFQGLGASNPWAMLATLIAPVCYAVALNLIRGLDGISRTVVTAVSLTMASLVLAPIALAIEGVPQIQLLETWLALAFIGLVLTSASFILLFWLIPKVGGTTASTITFIAPISSICLGVLLLNEVLELVHLIGFGVIFAGLIAIDGRLLRRREKTQPGG